MEAVKKLEANRDIVCFLGLNIADCLITWYILSIGGSEANWLGIMPIGAALTIKMALATLFAFWIYKYKRRLLKFLNIGLGLIVGYGLVVLILAIRVMTLAMTVAT